MLTDVAGVRVGHWTHPAARTGCTVVLLPEGTVASGEVRGGAPGTREWELLRPERLVQHIDAVVLCGGSAFGLAACDGVARWCEERGLGFPTAGGRVPIVVGAVLYDLGVGEPSVRPGPEEGYAACEAATAGLVATGAVGAGTGATVGKWRGPGSGRPGGLGTATARGPNGLVVAALIACNAWGDVRGDGATEQPDARSTLPPWDGRVSPLTNTTIGLVVTNARLDKLGCLLVAQSGHDGLARALEPVHATVDGDALVAAATGAVEGGPEPLVGEVGGARQTSSPGGGPPGGEGPPGPQASQAGGSGGGGGGGGGAGGGGAGGQALGVGRSVGGWAPCSGTSAGGQAPGSGTSAGGQAAQAGLELVRLLAASVVEAAVRSAVPATS